MDVPRDRRIWEPGDLLSIVGRGHEGRPLFTTDDDRGFFVERLGRVFRPGDVDLLARALLMNHYHLTIRVTDATPERLFRRLNTTVAQRDAPEFQVAELSGFSGSRKRRASGAPMGSGERGARDTDG